MQARARAPPHMAHFVAARVSLVFVIFERRWRLADGVRLARDGVRLSRHTARLKGGERGVCSPRTAGPPSASPPGSSEISKRGSLKHKAEILTSAIHRADTAQPCHVHLQGPPTSIRERHVYPVERAPAVHTWRAELVRPLHPGPAHRNCPNT